jgi:Na+-driven multidrug efflux pump
MLATLAADPVAALVDTAYVGHLGAAQLAGVGAASSIFNAVTKVGALGGGLGGRAGDRDRADSQPSWPAAGSSLLAGAAL